jgi:plasmid stabilization system protein ParE
LARLIYARRALLDLERLTDFLRESDAHAALATVDLIIEAARILENNPLIGRAVEANLRELVISRGKSGYLALYEYDAVHDAVLILAVRHQREAGYVQN